MSAPMPDIDELLRQLRDVVAERQAGGQYPEGLEQDLDAHFRRIIESRPGLPRLALFRRRIIAARRAARFGADRIPVSSRIPGGQGVHRAMTKAFARQAAGILAQVQEFADRALEALEAAVAVLESPETHLHTDLVEMLDVHAELLTRRDRMPIPPLEMLDDLLSRVEGLQAAEAERRWQPWFSRAQFDAAFGHGGRSRVEDLAVDALAGRSPVMDLAAGTGTLVARLSAEDINATGVIGPGESAAAPNLQSADRVAALASRPGASLAGLVLLQAEAETTAGELLSIVGLAADKLRPDGRLVVSVGAPPGETDNAAAEPRPPFNPTLGPPPPIDYTTFACRAAGFVSVEVERWPAGYLITATR